MSKLSTTVRYYRKDRAGSYAASGGVAITADKNAARRVLQLQTPLEAVTARALMFGKLTTLSFHTYRLIINFVKGSCRH